MWALIASTAYRLSWSSYDFWPCFNGRNRTDVASHKYTQTYMEPRPVTRLPPERTSAVLGHTRPRPATSLGASSARAMAWFVFSETVSFSDSVIAADQRTLTNCYYFAFGGAAITHVRSEDDKGVCVFVLCSRSPTPTHTARPWPYMTRSKVNTGWKGHLVYLLLEHINSTWEEWTCF